MGGNNECIALHLFLNIRFWEGDKFNEKRTLEGGEQIIEIGTRNVWIWMYWDFEGVSGVANCYPFGSPLTFVKTPVIWGEVITPGQT